MKRLSVKILTLSAAGLLAVAGFEGYSDRVEIPVPGDGPTGGFGHKDERLAVGSYVSPSQALAWLNADTSIAVRAVQRCVKVPLYQYEFDAYVSFAFNVGGSAFCSSTLVKKLNVYDYEGACSELNRWVYGPGAVKYAGLQDRRMKEVLLCRRGAYPQ